jgi:ferrochelatase
LPKTAVVLLNLGGPTSIDTIEPFLYNLFRDPDIFKIPIGQKFFAKVISKRRAPKVAEDYEQIGGKSPINEWTEKQRDLLEKELRDEGYDISVMVAMRYWKPLTEDTIACIKEGKYERIILLPLYPHNSITTMGSSFNEWQRMYDGDSSIVHYINEYPVQPTYIEALNERIDRTLNRFPEEVRKDVTLVFSAHGTPVSLVKKGDPYNPQIKQTMEAVMKARDYSHEYHLCYQSKVGPVKWLEPSTDHMIKELKEKGKDHLLVIPISFVSDHVETLFELDIEYREEADHVGIKNYIVMEGLNDSPIFIKALKELTVEKIKEIEGN